MSRTPMIRSVLTLFTALACTAAAQSSGSYTGSVSGVDLMDVDMMFIGAHPDDDSGVAATFARYILDEGYKGTVITLTGGEGGGNATGRETGRALGLIREEEERRSLSMLGVTSPHFLGLRDFYFTLSAPETEQKWGGPAFVCDVVRLVRLRRPEVLVTMWPGPGTHGQHQMAARAATLAYTHAGDPAYCPDQVAEGVQPFTPLKLYYTAGEADATVGIPTDTVSRTARIRYADLKSVAQFNYRSQGWDANLTLPAKTTPPEQFMLVSARVPVQTPETSLLTGAVQRSATSPTGVRLSVTPEAYEVGQGRATPVTVQVTNTTAQPLTAVQLDLQLPAGWTATGRPAPRPLSPGETASATFQVTPPATAPADRTPLTGTFAALQGTQPVSGQNAAFVRPVPAVVASFAPTFDVAAYQTFARDTGTEWVTGALPTRLPVVVGRTTAVTVNVTNRSAARAEGPLTLELPTGVTVVGSPTYALDAGQSAAVPVQLQVTPAALPPGRQSGLLPVSVTTGAFKATANLYVLPGLTIPRVGTPPVIDGNVADLTGADVSIGPDDLWWRAKPESPADASARVTLAYDDQYLYVGLTVQDELVACNIAPDDVKAQLRSDAIGITVAPDRTSQDTSTTLQAAAFPCTTAGFQARGFRDADAKQGPMEDTAPGMQVASVKQADGYSIEFRLPWAAMPSTPKAGDTIGLNVVLYDGDTKDARVGANISQSGLAWASFSWGGKQALPYLWPQVTLGR
ncbi:PIG-L family deacetylase [Deinococcus rufus]|uniref:PIG-L family deacetylase n=1 Tax=Deinococcus rufus TaxID=2136097 RepID=A0ABV7Z9W4_9DEIO